MNFDINDNNIFVKNSEGSIKIDGMLSDDEKQELQEAYECDCGEIQDETNVRLAEFLHRDVIPNLETSGLPPEIQEKVIQLSEIHSYNPVDLGITIPSSLEESLSQGDLDLSISRAVGDIESYISRELQLPDDSNISSEEYNTIIANIRSLLQGNIDGISNIIEKEIDNNPDLSLRELTWIINSKIKNYFSQFRDEFILPIKALFIFSGEKGQNEILEGVGSGASRDNWSKDRIQRTQENLYMHMEILKETLLDERSSIDDVYFQYEQLRDREFNLGDFETEVYTSVEKDFDISLLNEEDKQIEAQSMFYFLCGVGLQCLPYVGGIPSALLVDLPDLYESEDATMIHLKSLGLVPREYHIEKTWIDYIFAGVGIAFTVAGVQFLAKSGKLPKAFKRIKNLSPSMISEYFSHFASKMGLGEETSNALKGLLGVKIENKQSKLGDGIASSSVEETYFSLLSKVPNELEKRTTFDVILKSNLSDLIPEILVRGETIKLYEHEAISSNLDQIVKKIPKGISVKLDRHFEFVGNGQHSPLFVEIKDIFKQGDEYFVLDEKGRKIDVSESELIHCIMQIARKDESFGIFVDSLRRVKIVDVTFDGSTYSIIDSNGLMHDFPFGIREFIHAQIREGYLGDTPGVQKVRDVYIFKEENPELLEEIYVSEAIKARDDLLESSGRFTLSRQDFNNFFPRNGVIKQGNIGNCYLIASIDAMRYSPHFEAIIRSSVKKFPDGSWEVKIPLLDPNGKKIIISTDELKGFKNPNKGLKLKWENEKNDRRSTLGTLSGAEGYKVLEAAFTKYRFGLVNGVSKIQSEAGYMRDALTTFGGDYFHLESIFNGEYVSGKWEYPSFFASSDVSKQVTKIFETYNPDIHIITASKIRNIDIQNLPLKIRIKMGLNKLGLRENIEFVENHAYSIQNYDKDTKIVTLANPWDTGKPFTLTLDEFLKVFSNIDMARINNKRLMQGLQQIHL